MPSKGKKIKFGVGFAVILATLGWLAYSGIQESKTYYVTVPELLAHSDALSRRFRVAGDVKPGTIRRMPGRTEFIIEQGGKVLSVYYTGTEPLPDTLVDRAQAIADGRYQQDGTFRAEFVQAKCASKYAPAPQKAPTETTQTSANYGKP
jgi:cytochrome c-type biogenesis protein CcmE